MGMQIERSCFSGVEGEAVVVMMLGPVKEGDYDARWRECWLVEASADAGELLDELEEFDQRTGGSEMLSMKDSEDFLSPEAAAATMRAGARHVILAYQDIADEGDGAQADAFEGIKSALKRLGEQGLALGPARVGPNEHRRYYELEAALACEALSERRELAREAAEAQKGDPRAKRAL